MKHLLNDLTEEEKNSIREQHAGGMKVMNESFSKLLNSKLGDSKPLVSEQVEEMDEQSQMPGFTPQMNQLYDFIKKNTISMGAITKVLEYMRQSKPAPPPNQQTRPAAPQKQQQPVQSGATRTTQQKTQQPAQKQDYTVVNGKKYYSSGAVR